MEGMNRRHFLGKALKGAGLAVLAAVPGSFFSKQKLFAQTETLENVFQRTTSGSVVAVLNGSRLSPVDKLAIFAARKIPTGEIRTTLSQWDSLAEKAKRGGGGFFCGGSCGDTAGFICGNGCRAPQSGSFALDMAGDLNSIGLAQMSKTGFKTALQKALNLL